MDNRRHVRNYPHGESRHITRTVLRQLTRVCTVCGEADESLLVVDHASGDSIDNSPGTYGFCAGGVTLRKPPIPHTGASYSTMRGRRERRNGQPREYGYLPNRNSIEDFLGQIALRIQGGSRGLARRPDGGCGLGPYLWRLRSRQISTRSRERRS